MSFIRARGNDNLHVSIARSVMGLLHRVRLLKKVSLLELYPGLGVQYVRSGGVSATMVRLNLKNHTGVVRLPSGVKKAFSLYSLVTFGPVALKEKRRVRNTRSGY